MAGRLDLTERKAFRHLLYLRDNLPDGYRVAFDAGMPVGAGRYKYDGRNITVGVSGMVGRGLKMFAGVSDYLFTSAVVAMYHEYGHYLDDMDLSTPKEVILSAISTFNNPGYRLNGWKEFPHEISVEHIGVLMVYDAMESLFGEAGERGLKSRQAAGEQRCRGTRSLRGARVEMPTMASAAVTAADTLPTGSGG